MEDRFLKDMKVVVDAIRDAGYIPHDQLYGYVLTGNSDYITRRNKAREIVTKMDREKIRRYLQLRKVS